MVSEGGVGVVGAASVLLLVFGKKQNLEKLPLTSKGVSKASMMPPTMSRPSVPIPIPRFTQSTLSSREQSAYSDRCWEDTLTPT